MNEATTMDSESPAEQEQRKKPGPKPAAEKLAAAEARIAELERELERRNSATKRKEGRLPPTHARRGRDPLRDRDTVPLGVRREYAGYPKLYVTQRVEANNRAIVYIQFEPRGQAYKDHLMAAERLEAAHDLETVPGAPTFVRMKLPEAQDEDES